MKKTIINSYGRKVEIETKGEIWGFKTGDIITNISMTSKWYQKNVIVEGFGSGDDILWGRIEGEKRCLFSSSPHGLELLKKPQDAA